MRILVTRIENVRTNLGRAKLLMDNYLLHNNNIFFNNRRRKLDLISKTTPIYDESRRP